MCSLVVWNVTGVHWLCEMLQVFTGCVKCYRCSLVVMCNVTCVPWSCVMFQEFSENCMWCYSCSVVVMCNVTPVQWLLCVMLQVLSSCVWCYRCWVVVCNVTGVQFKMLSMHSEKPISASPRLHPISQKFLQCCLWNGSNVRLTDNSPLLSFEGRSSSTSSFHISLQGIDSVKSLVLCLLVVSQASQYFRSSKKQATCEGCFAHKSICSVISLHSSMSRAVHPQEFSKVDVNHWHIPVWASSHSVFHFL